MMTTPDEKRKMLALAEQGLTYKIIAKELGKTESNIKWHLQQMGYRRGQKFRPTFKDKDKIILLRQQGMTQKDIARKLSCSHMTVKKYLAKAGMVGLRPKHQRKQTGIKRKGTYQKKPVLKKESNRRCLACGKDPFPNYQYCPACHSYRCQKIHYAPERSCSI